MDTPTKQMKLSERIRELLPECAWIAEVAALEARVEGLEGALRNLKSMAEPRIAEGDACKCSMYDYSCHCGELVARDVAEVVDAALSRHEAGGSQMAPVTRLRRGDRVRVIRLVDPHGCLDAKGKIGRVTAVHVGSAGVGDSPEWPAYTVRFDKPIKGNDAEVLKHDLFWREELRRVPKSRAAKRKEG